MIVQEAIEVFENTADALHSICDRAEDGEISKSTFLCANVITNVSQISHDEPAEDVIKALDSALTQLHLANNCFDPSEHERKSIDFLLRISDITLQNLKTYFA